MVCKVSDQGEALIRGLRPAPEPGSGNCAPANLDFFFDFPKLWFQFLQPFYKAGQVVLITKLTAVFGSSSNSPNVSLRFKLGDVTLYLTTAEFQSVSQSFFAGEWLAIDIPPVIGEMHDDCKLSWVKT
jgi:hypothetical protein